MSRCICCNIEFYPKIEYHSDGSFKGFEEMCSGCISKSYELESYDEVFEPYRVSDCGDFLTYVDKLSTVNRSD
jgi:hypothetical protein